MTGRKIEGTKLAWATVDAHIGCVGCGEWIAIGEEFLANIATNTFICQDCVRIVAADARPRPPAEHAEPCYCRTCGGGTKVNVVSLSACAEANRLAHETARASPAYEVLKERAKRNRGRCRACGDIIESKTVHDFQRCSCGKSFVDGGTEYCRAGGEFEGIKE